MKTCLMCGCEFPLWIKINGKLRNLKNRKYCIECSPFGQHNTKQLHKPTKPRKNYRQSPEYYRIRRYKKLCKAVDYKGGVCEKCGKRYHPVCYDFHHINPDEKEHGVSRLLGLSWQRIQGEIDKCQLLCANCHQEVHEDEFVPKNPDKYMNNYMNKYHKENKLKLIKYKGGKCQSCGYDKCNRSLSFHHINGKDYQISLYISRSFNRLKKESNKCELLCSCCHRMKHKRA